MRTDAPTRQRASGLAYSVCCTPARCSTECGCRRCGRSIPMYASSPPPSHSKTTLQSSSATFIRQSNLRLDKQRIREAATVPAYLEHVSTRFKWNASISDTIDWQAYTQTIGRFRTQRTQITKLCNNLLPTARWVNRYDSLTTEHCLHCGETEDRDHIMQCSFAARQRWRSDLLSSLRKAHDSDQSDHNLTDILINGLDGWHRAVKNNCFELIQRCPLRRLSAVNGLAAIQIYPLLMSTC